MNFEMVKTVGLELRNVEATTKYDGYDYYEKHPVVLARLSRLNRDALRDLLSVSWRLTLPKARKK